MKFGQRDYRGGGRSSARLTAPIVAAGAVAKKWLAQRYGVTVRGYCAQIGDIAIPFESHDNVNDNPFSPGSRGLAETGRAGKLRGRAAQEAATVMARRFTSKPPVCR